MRGAAQQQARRPDCRQRQVPRRASTAAASGLAARSSQEPPAAAPVAAAAPAPLALDEQGPGAAAPYGEYAWVRRAARDDRQRLLPHLSAENSFAAATVLPGTRADGRPPPSPPPPRPPLLLPWPPPPPPSCRPDALARELGEWALSAAVGGLEDADASASRATPPDAPPLPSFPGDTAAAAALCGRPPLSGKRARRALGARLGPACLRRAAFDAGPASARPRDACLSPCGRFLALLLPLRVSVLCAQTGETVAEAGGAGAAESAAAASAGVLPLDASLAWASPGWGGSDDGDRGQHLFFLDAEPQGGGLTVERLSVGSGSGSGKTAGAGSSRPAAAVCLPAAACGGWARAALAKPRGGGPLFAVGWAPDGAPAGAHLVLPPSPRGAAGTALRFAEEADDEATGGGAGASRRRVALSVWAGPPSSPRSSSSSSCWVVARRWGHGLAPELMLGRVSAEPPHWAPWAPLAPPPDAARGETLEAVFLPPLPPPPPPSPLPRKEGPPARAPPAPPAPPPPYLVTLSVRPLPPAGLSSELVARRLDLLPPGAETGAAAAAAAAGRWGLAPRAEASAGPEAALSPPLPPPFLRDGSLWHPAGADAWRLSNAVWDAEAQEVRADVCAMGSPPRRVVLPLALPAAAAAAAAAAAGAAPAAGDPGSGAGGGAGAGRGSLVCSPARVLASTASPPWWAEAAASRPWPRLWRTVAPSRDGARVPVTVLLPLSLLGGTTTTGGGAGAEAAASDAAAAAAAAASPGRVRGFPLLILAYGAYGAREPGASFDPAHEALARRGWAVAVAHVRGGAGACGARLPGAAAPAAGGGDDDDDNDDTGGGSTSSSAWRAAGRTAERKRAGVEDVLAAVRHLVGQGAADPRRVCLSADSAGAWVAVPAAADHADADDADAAALFPFRALLLTVPALCPSDEARAQWEDARGGGAAPGPLFGAAATASDAAELGSRGGGSGGGAEEGRETAEEGEGQEGGERRRPWDPYAACAARLASSCPETRILLRTALDDRVVGFWEAVCFAARVRRLRVEAAVAAAAATGARSAAAGGAGASAAAAAAAVAAAAAAASSTVLLRTLPRGGHAAFAASGADSGEEVLALAFLLGSIE